SALSLIEEGFIPDIVISDIRMPGMLGIDMCKQIRQNYPDVQIIFISGYSDKEYLTSAISIGVVGYVEKPIDTSVLGDNIEKAVQAVLRVRASKQTSLHALLEPSIENSGSTGKEEHFVMLIIYTLNEIENIHLFPDIIKQKLNEISTDEYTVMADRRNSKYYAIMLGRNFPWTDKTMETVRAKILDLKLPGDKWFVSSGRDVKKQEEITVSYDDAVKAVKNLSYKGWNSTADYREICSRCEEVFTEDLSVKLYNLMQQGALDRIEEWSSDVYKKLKDLKTEMEFEVRNLYYSVDKVVCQFDTKEQLYQGTENVSAENFPNKCETLEELYEYVIEHIKHVVIKSGGTTDNDQVISVCAYINEHLEDPGLAVSELADYVHLSQAYLSTLFSKKMNMTIVQYIAQTRHEMALKLIQNPSMKLSDIARKCGYNDQKYFAKVFRKKVGMTPTEYRESLGIK
nr:AraC family transcriptional regulator [Butyrivibrio sp.]